jgi:two-component system phosphate regulon response regulator PhoB
MAKFLVVDDDPVLTRFLQAQLGDMGYQMDTASDGLDALVKLKQNDYQAVILDVMMPEINGYDVCYQLRFNKDFAHIPIILLTERQRELDASVMDRTNIKHLTKPVNIKELKTTLESVVV